MRSLLWEGQASHQGRFYTVAASLPRAPKTPLLLSALGPAAFRLAGALDFFRTLPAYVSMFNAAGLFDGPEEEAAARLATMLIVAGDEAAVAARLRDVLATEIDELLVTTLPVADEAAERRRLIHLLGKL